MVLAAVNVLEQTTLCDLNLRIEGRGSKGFDVGFDIREIHALYAAGRPFETQINDF